MKKQSIRLALQTSAVLALFCSAAHAVVQVTSGTPFPLPAGPRYLTFGEFDGDGVFDLAASSVVDNQVTILSASPTGNLARRGLSLPVRSNPRQLVSQDFTEDGLADLAVANQSAGARNSEVWIFPRLDDGLFDAPVIIEVPDNRLEGLAAADFDRRNGPDFAVSHGRSAMVTAMLNNADDSGFTALPSVDVLHDPRTMVTGLFNRDNLPDLAILNATESRTEQITILLSKEGPTFSFGAQAGLSGEPVVAIAAGDLNADSRTDVVIVHEQAARRFGVTVLLNQTGSAPGAVQSFRTIGPRNFECPRLGGLDPSRCEPQDVVIADLDLDTRPDLAISIWEPGAVMFFAGSGDGEFEPDSFERVGDQPTDLVAADVTGDRVVDIAGVDFGNDTAFVLVNNAVPKQANGAECTRRDQCISGECVDGVCCASGSCPQGQRCDVVGAMGSCSVPAANGSRCSVGGSCASSFCVDAVCCASAVCSANQRCDVPGSAGRCALAPPTPTATATRSATPTATNSPTPQPNGRDCGSADQCTSNACVDGVCCASPECGADKFCNIAEVQGSCASKRIAGERCQRGSDCQSAVCARGVCVGGAAGTPTHTPSPPSTPPPTATPLPLGAPCESGSGVCASGACVHGVCCAEAVCALGERCDVHGSAGECAPRLPLDAECGADTDCVSGDCAMPESGLGRCVPSQSPTPGPRPCVGDCDGSAEVTVDEILILIDVALGQQTADACSSGDNDGNGQISVDEIISAVSYALTGCPPPPTGTILRTPTSTFTPRPTRTPTSDVPPTETPVPPTATPTEVPPTATPTEVPPTATPAIRTVDLSEYRTFRFDYFGANGFCPPIGGPFSVTLQQTASGVVVGGSYLREGNGSADSCLPEYTGPAACAVAEPITGAASLTPAEIASLDAVFSAIELRGVDPGCSPEVCSVLVVQWDDTEATDFPCEAANRLSSTQAASIVSVVNGLLEGRR